jgi:hypothetical protein
MLGFIFANGEKIATIYCSWETQRPKTYTGWFLASSGLRKYEACLRYHITEGKGSAFKFMPKKYSFNSAATHIVDMLAKYPKGTVLGLGWPMYGSMSPLDEVKYRTVFDLRNIAVPTIMVTRDFYTDSSMKREEQGDEALDKVTILKPLGL